MLYLVQREGLYDTVYDRAKKLQCHSVFPRAYFLGQPGHFASQFTIEGAREQEECNFVKVLVRTANSGGGIRKQPFRSKDNNGGLFWSCSSAKVVFLWTLAGRRCNEDKEIANMLWQRRLRFDLFIMLLRRRKNSINFVGRTPGERKRLLNTTIYEEKGKNKYSHVLPTI